MLLVNTLITINQKLSLCPFAIQYNSMRNRLLPHNDEAKRCAKINICLHIPLRDFRKTIKRVQGGRGILRRK